MRFTKLNMMMMAVMVGALLAPAFPSLQAQTASQGGAFLPTQDYTVTGRWTMSGGVAITGTSTIGTGVTLTSPTITGTPTITLQDSTTTLVDDGDATKIVKWQTSGLTTATTRTWSWQDSSDTIVGRATTDTLTNKTLTAPVMTSPTITSTTNQLVLGTTNLTTLSAASPAGSATVNIPTVAGGISSASSCGTTATCSAAAATPNVITKFGTVALSSGTPSTATITALPFTSSSSYVCTASPSGATAAIAAAGIAINYVSASSITLTGPNTVTTVINYQCTGV